MARHPRVFASGLLYLVIVRGNRRQQTFLTAQNYRAYLTRRGGSDGVKECGSRLDGGPARTLVAYVMVRRCGFRVSEGARSHEF
jgi:hypothetical protein